MKHLLALLFLCSSAFGQDCIIINPKQIFLTAPPPILTSMTINESGSNLTLHWDTTVTCDNDSGEDITLFGTSAAIASASAGSGTNDITYLIDPPAVFGETITANLGSAWSRGGVLNTPYTGYSVTNNAVAAGPTLVSATVAINGSDVTLVWSEAVTAAGWVTTGSFTIGGDSPHDLTYVSGDGTNTFIFNVGHTQRIYLGETATLSFDAVDPVTNLDEDETVAAFSDHAVINNSTQTP